MTADDPIAGEETHGETIEVSKHAWKSLVQRVEKLEKKVEKLENGGESKDTLPIERHARKKDEVLEDDLKKSVNKQIVAKVWRELPNYAKKPSNSDSFVIDTERQKKILVEFKDYRSKKDVYTQDAKRLRSYFREMSNGSARVDKNREGKERVIIPVNLWKGLRPDEDVEVFLR